jgi:hypothetical protein
MLEFPFASFPAIRFVKSSDAFLAFTKFRGITSTIEFPAPYSWQTQMGYERMWKALAEQVDFTFHWGQCQKWGDTPTQARDRIRQVFDEPGGNRLDKWRQQRHRFLVAGGLRTFANPLLKECGIAD